MRLPLSAVLAFAASLGVIAPSPRSTFAQEGRMKLSSSAFAEQGAIPKKYTCDAENVSPPLTWSDVPAGTKSLVLIVDDPDVPDPAAPKRIWVHWVVYNIAPDAFGLSENTDVAGLPKGALEGHNDAKEIGYGGPCPPIGKHRYFFKLYALDKVLPELKKASKADVEKAMQGHVLGKTELIGMYGPR